MFKKTKDADWVVYMIFIDYSRGGVKKFSAAQKIALHCSPHLIFIWIPLGFLRTMWDNAEQYFRCRKLEARMGTHADTFSSFISYNSCAR